MQPMKDVNLIGQKVAALRKELKLTQEDLAGAAEMDRSYLSEIENGHKNFSISTLINLSRALQVKPSELLKKAGL